MATKKSLPEDVRRWVEARERHHLSHAHVQMARELGMNPKRLGKLDNHRQEFWKAPLPEFIERLYMERFGRRQPNRVVSIEERAKEIERKRAERRERKGRAREARKRKAATTPSSEMAAGDPSNFPAATIAYYGPDATKATKVAVGIVLAPGAKPSLIQRFHSDDSDVRTDPDILAAIRTLITSSGVQSVVIADGIIGCPHEEGADYPEGKLCPECPYWAHRDRWTGETIH